VSACVCQFIYIEKPGSSIVLSYCVLCDLSRIKTTRYKSLVLKIFTQHFRNVFVPKTWQNRATQCLVYKAIWELVIRYSL